MPVNNSPFSRPDDAQPVVGSTGARLLQDNDDSVVTQVGAKRDEASIEVATEASPTDLDPNADGDFTSSIRAIGGTSVVGIGLESQDGNDFSVELRVKDSDDNDLFTYDKDKRDNLQASNSEPTDVVITSLTAVGDRVEVTVTSEESAGVQNRVNGSVVATPGAPSEALSTIIDNDSPVTKALVYDDSPGADTDILGSDLTPGETPVTFRVNVVLDSAAQFNAQVTHSGGTEELGFNQGNALTANEEFQFDLTVRSNESINFQVESAVTVSRLSVVQIPFAEA